MTNPKAERLAEEFLRSLPPETSTVTVTGMFLAGYNACAKEQGELLGYLEETLEVVWAGHTEQARKTLCTHALDRLRAHRLGEEGK